MQYLVACTATKQIDSIWLHIAQDSENSADAWLAKLELTFEMISHSAGVGRVLKEFAPLAVQVWPHGNYLIFYRVTRRGVAIRAVVHGAQDWPRLLATIRV